MLGTETVRRESLIPPHRDRNGSDDYRLKKIKQSKRQYAKRKAAGFCSQGGCPADAELGHAHCRRHMQKMSERNKERYHDRAESALCIYCGKRPGFWGVRCAICRQRFAKDPLPIGARRALRLYREAEEQHEVELRQVAARFVARKLLASGDINGQQAKVLRLYAGLDNGQWRTYAKVGKLMKISKQAVHQLLRPSKLALAQVLGDRVPWK